MQKMQHFLVAFFGMKLGEKKIQKAPQNSSPQQNVFTETFIDVFEIFGNIRTCYFYQARLVLTHEAQIFPLNNENALKNKAQ